MPSYSCTGLNPDVGTAQTLVGAVDCFVRESMAQSYGGLLGPGSSFALILTAALTIYIAIIGFQLILGRAQLRMGELVPKFFLIGAILALTSSWGTYQLLVFDVLTDGPEEVARMVSNTPANARDVADRVDYVAGLATDVAAVWGRTNQPQTPPASLNAPPQTPTSVNQPQNANAPTDAQRAAASILPNATGNNSPGPNILIWSALLLTLASAGTMAVAKALLGLLLALGPIFAMLALFRFTRDLMLGWARAALFLALVPLFALLTSLAALEMIQPMVESMALSANQGVFSLRYAVGLFVAVLVTIGVSLLIFRVAQIMTARWTPGRAGQGVPEGSIIPATMVPSQMPTLQSTQPANPRVDVLLNALERQAAMDAPRQLESDLRREAMVNAVANDITRSTAQLQLRPDPQAVPQISVTAQRRIEAPRVARSGLPLRPARGSA